MFGKNKLQPSTFKTIAALTVIPQEVREGTETSDDQFICPIHGEVKRRKSQQRYRKDSSSSPLERIKTFFGKSDLEIKLATHGIKAKVSKAKIRALHDVSKKSNLLAAEELNALSIDKLRELRDAFDREVSKLNSDMTQLLEEKHVMADKNNILKKESKDLEEKVKEMLRPWVNRYPHSDELTRAYLIN